MKTIALGLLALISNPVESVRCANEVPEDGGQRCFVVFSKPDESKVINLKVQWTDGTSTVVASKRTSLQLAHRGGRTVKNVSAGGFARIPVAVSITDLDILGAVR